MFDHDLSFFTFFFLGFWVVVAYAWQRFNEPSFPNQQALPRAVEPLRYLFLRPTYRKARLTYVVGLLLLYGVLVAPGSSILAAMGGAGYKDFPPQAWALLVALFLVGLAPNSVQWLNIIEEQLRRWVHAWFLVPAGVERTIAILEDARYEPPASQLNFVQSPRRERLQDDLKLSTGTLRYRWARATVLVTSLKYIGGGVAHPLQKAAFEPFEEDFDAILEKYRALKPDVESPGAEPTSDDTSRSVDHLLKRIYAYISWGIRYQANSEREVDQTLEELGFRVPKTGGRHLFDIVVPAVLLVALITMVFWVMMDEVNRAMGAPAPTRSQSIVSALTSAMAASFMYGSAIFIALNRRAAKIEQKSWHEGSPRSLIPIAIRAGLVTWGVIVVSTVYWKLPETWQSLIGLLQVVKPSAMGDGGNTAASADWAFLPIKVATALPWLLVGATASAVLATRVSGDVRRIGNSYRLVDAIFLAIALGLAAEVAQLLQNSLLEVFHDHGLFHDDVPPLKPIDSLAEFACGAVIGFMVPQTCRADVTMPSDPIMARALRDLLRQAKVALGSKAAADDWVFMPNDDLGGITPAEAIRYKTHATGVGRLLDSEAQRRREDAHPDRSDRLAPVLIEGGRRNADRAAASPAQGDERVGA